MGYRGYDNMGTYWVGKNLLECDYNADIIYTSTSILDLIVYMSGIMQF